MENAHTGTALTAGDIIEGGYYVGAFNIDGERYGLIVSPKAGGDMEPSEWGEYGASIDATSHCDGLKNTHAMAEAGSDLAKTALAANINGRNDWYIPSRDEQEMLYRILKPSDTTNAATFRDGDNPSSLPPGYPYNPDSPAQTDLEAFRSGGKEALEKTAYWSSSQYSALLAWGQNFDNGNQGSYRKGNALRARLVRRFKLSI